MKFPSSYRFTNQPRNLFTEQPVQNIRKFLEKRLQTTTFTNSTCDSYLFRELYPPSSKL